MRSFALGAACLTAVLVTPATAQLPQASAAVLDRGLDVTAPGGGFAAIASNPAGLARADAPGFSLAIPAFSTSAGVGPIALSDLVDYEGQFIDAPLKEEWLSRVSAAGGETGRVSAGLTGLALTAGSVGFQISSRIGGTTDLSPDAIELFLYGNAGRTGAARALDLEGSYLEGFAVTTGALSVGMRATEQLLVGITGKYTIGQGLVVGRDGGSFLSSDPIAVELDFPILVSYTDGFRFDNGSGFGVDLGAIWEGPITFGMTIENVFNTFAWRLEDFRYVPAQAVFDEDVRASDFGEQPLAAAPRAVRADFEALAEDYGLETRVAVGASMPLTPSLTVQGTLQKSLTEGMGFDPDFYGGAGAELTALSLLPLRAHVAVITDGYELGGGASLVLGPVHVSGGASLRSESTHDAVLGTFTLSFGSH